MAHHRVPTYTAASCDFNDARMGDGAGGSTHANVGVRAFVCSLVRKCVMLYINCVCVCH